MLEECYTLVNTAVIDLSLLMVQALWEGKVNCFCSVRYLKMSSLDLQKGVRVLVSTLTILGIACPLRRF